MAKKPAYMLPDGHTPRAVNAVRLLTNIKEATIDTIIKLSHSPYLANGYKFIPTLVKSFDLIGNNETLKEPINILRKWDYLSDTNSIATTLSVLWVEKVLQFNLSKQKRPITNEINYPLTNGSTISLDSISPVMHLALLDSVIKDLNKDWSTWQIPWGKINRFQRNAPGIEPSDSLFSWAVTATPSFMGSLNAYTSKKSKTSKARYGTTGNTFVAVVSFGPKLKAKSIFTGGNSSNPTSKHFTDQANGYINHQFKDVNFYRSDVLKNKEVSYHPGENIF
jgi:acyl-homoserine lactone acylase PvdQ